MQIKPRYPLIDLTRVLAILLMVFFHLFYDLNLFGFVDIDFYQQDFWYSLPRIIVFLFLLSVGMSLREAHYPLIKWKKFWKRWGQIVLSSLVISLITYKLFPENWIYFGTLHCIAITSLLGLPFIRTPFLAGFSGAILLILSITFKIDIPWWKLPHTSMDYIPPFPWLGWVLIGISLHRVGFHQSFRSWPPGAAIWKWMGRHSLLIYLIHQPLLFSLAWFLWKLSPSD